jgi:hypothetical protein
LLLAATALIAGCGGSSNDDGTSSATATAPAKKQRASVPPARQPGAVNRAERAARTDKPNIPLWKGAVFHGTAVSDTEVCVDQTLTEESAAAVGRTGNRTSHVVVTLPELTIGEAQDGSCARREQNADKAIIRARQFFERMDSLAVELDDAISVFQHGGSGARISRLRGRISKTLTDYLLAGGDESVGGNLLLSAATTARDAARSDDRATLARQRREIAEARTKLAEEAIE